MAHQEPGTAVAADLMFCASLGVCVSARATASGRAVLAAVTIAVLLAAVPALLYDPGPLQKSRLAPPGPEQGASLGACLSPPVVWRLLAGDARQWAGAVRDGWPDAILLSAEGYAVMAGALLAAAYVRLKRDAVRERP